MYSLFLIRLDLTNRGGGGLDGSKFKVGQCEGPQQVIFFLIDQHKVPQFFLNPKTLPKVRVTSFLGGNLQKKKHVKELILTRQRKYTKFCAGAK